MDSLKFNWLDWLVWPIRKWRVSGQVEAADEIPDKLPRRTIVLVGTVDYPKWIAFDCPCNRGHRIMLPLGRSSKPHWQLQQLEPASIWPSVDSNGDSFRCHYFIRAGRVEWAHN